uniref:Cytochrome P450 734A6 n=1 Tax=Anthurium amnicola TaxID=1678845 RepID=A0A1D1YP79_9ARAE
MAKQVLSKFVFYKKETPRPFLLSLLGKGLVLVEGLDWVRHRRVVSPAFTMDKLKAMTKQMAECTISMFDGWRDQVIHEQGQGKEIEMSIQFQELTANVICRTAFGSSYAEGMEVFLAQKDLQLLAFTTAFDIILPGRQYLPTRANLRKWRLDRTVRGKLKSIIQRRLDSNSSSYGNDLLGLMMDACRTDSGGSQGNLTLNMDEIIDECKTFFFAGHETTSHLLTWTMFLLGSNPQWQERLREEVLRECGMQVPDADMLSKLKLTTMVLLEAVRLYCPVIFLLRKSSQDLTLGNLMIPKDTTITIPVTMINRNKEVWGADANDFNPLRFVNGISRAAKHPNALLSFSVGPRSCVGQNFALLEAKLVIAMILQRFSFSLSANYRHAPTSLLTLQPQFGLPVVMTPLCT